MKWMIASDIHGSETYCQRMLDAYHKENASRLLLLGDILYHGPRNDLPHGYIPKKVIELLNAIKDDILCVRGNCDTEVDQMVLNFPMMADYNLLTIDNCVIIATHGHRFNEDSLPPLHKRDILLNGHTHIPALRVHENYVYMNPGSISIPKEGSSHQYMLLENGVFTWKDLDGNIKQTYCLHVQ